MNRLGRWIGNTFLWWEFPIGLLAGICAYLASGRPIVRTKAVAVLLAEGGLAVALLAVVLAALSILVAFLSEDYILLLKRTSEGIQGAIRPYKIVGALGGLAAIAAFGAALVWDVSRAGVQRWLLASVSGLFAWTIAGTVDLIFRTAWHGELRSRLSEIPDAARRALERKRASNE